MGMLDRLQDLAAGFRGLDEDGNVAVADTQISLSREDAVCLCTCGGDSKKFACPGKSIIVSAKDFCEAVDKAQEPKPKPEAKTPAKK